MGGSPGSLLLRASRAAFVCFSSGLPAALSEPTQPTLPHFASCLVSLEGPASSPSRACLRRLFGSSTWLAHPLCRPFLLPRSAGGATWRRGGSACTCPTRASTSRPCWRSPSASGTSTRAAGRASPWAFWRRWWPRCSRVTPIHAHLDLLTFVRDFTFEHLSFVAWHGTHFENREGNCAASIAGAAASSPRMTVVKVWMGHREVEPLFCFATRHPMLRNVLDSAATYSAIWCR